MRSLTNKRIFGLTAVIAIALAIGFVAVSTFISLNTDAGPTVAKGDEELYIETQTGRHRFVVEIANTPRERATGLMDRHEMADDHGMLFDFGSEQALSFWMRNTYISLDMIFVRNDGSVVSIATDTVPLSEKNVPSEGDARFVLEVVAGTTRRLQLKVGDRVDHRLTRPSR